MCSETQCCSNYMKCCRVPFVFPHPRVQVELWDSDDPVPRHELLKKVKGCDGLLCVLTEKVDAELLDAAGLTLTALRQS